MNMSSRQLFILSALSFYGCASDYRPPSPSRPFARLYGERKSRWVNNNQAAIFNHSNGDANFHQVEFDGFKKLDLANQKLYLVIRFCTHQSASAEDGSMMLFLMARLKCSKADLRSYMLSQDKKGIELYAAYLGGSSRQFYANVHHYCQP